MPPESVRKVPSDDDFKINISALGNAVSDDRAKGLQPLCVCGNAGATNTGAIDPLEAMADLCREEELWFHVDGAYGGFAVLAPEAQSAFRGMERADSLTLDPHKWLFQPYETGCLLVRDTRLLEDAFRILPEYLQDTALGDEQVNFADRGIQLTRSFRALKVWISIQTLGMKAFRKGIQDGLELARRAAGFIGDSKTLELTGPASLGIVCFRFRPLGARIDGAELEELNQGIQDEIVRSGLAMMSSTRLRGEFSLRLSILNYRSTWTDVRETLEAVEGIGDRLADEREGA
jgi:glutamate/tyrosine decarboxylase-like PLP-dependent enzyme